MNKNFTLLSQKSFYKLSKSLLVVVATAFTYTSNAQIANSTTDPLTRISGREDASKRTQFSRHFVNDFGETTSLVTAGTSLNYKDASGNWQVVDLNITTNNTGNHPQYQWANTTNNFKSFYSTNITKGIITEYALGVVEEGLDKKMVWMDEHYNIISSTNIVAGNASKFENKVMYSNVLPGIDLVYYQQNDGRKMDYVLNDIASINNAPANAKYLGFAERFELPNGSTTTAIKSETGNTIAIDVTIGNNKMFRYDLPQHADSGTNKVTSYYIINQNTIYTIVEKSWLESGLTYPVMIDPTVTVYPLGANDYNTGSIDSQLNNHPNADINAGVREAYGSASGETERRFFRAWASFDVSAIPVGSTINDVVFGGYLVVNSLYFDGFLDPEDEQRIVIAPITSGIPNQMTGGALYNVINENSSNGILTINPLPENIVTPLDVSLNISSNPQAIPSITNSLSSGIYSIGFVAKGDFYSDFSDFVNMYGSTRATATTGGKPYLIVTYTESMSTIDYSKTVGLYPNPAQSELFIKSDENIRSIEVFSLLGQSVLKTAGAESIQVGSLANGIYAIQIILENGNVINQKFAKN